MEEDTGKLTHLGSDTGRIEGATTSLLDYNRAGVPLIEIVTKPIEGTGERAPEIARAYVTALRDLLRGVGRFRCADGPGLDALRLQRVAQADRRRRSSAPAPRPRTSTRSRASRWRCATRCAVRQRFSSPAAEIIQETRHFHEDGYTTPGRSKETARGLPVLPRARPGAGRAQRRTRSSGCARRSPSCRGCRATGFRQDWGISDEVMRDLVNNGAIDLVDRHRRARRLQRGRPRLVGKLPGAEGQRGRRRARRAADHPGAGRRGGQAGRRRQAVQQAGPPGGRGCARRRGRARAGDDRPRAGGGARRLG